MHGIITPGHRGAAGPTTPGTGLTAAPTGRWAGDLTPGLTSRGAGVGVRHGYGARHGAGVRRGVGRPVGIIPGIPVTDPVMDLASIPVTVPATAIGPTRQAALVRGVRVEVRQCADPEVARGILTVPAT